MENKVASIIDGKVIPPDPPYPNVSVGVKGDGEKLDLSLCMPLAIAALGRSLTYGKIKYDAWNWAKGFSWMRVISALMRHLLCHWVGKDIDEESGLPHVDCIMFNAAVLTHFYYTGAGVDDRPKQFHNIPGIEHLLTMMSQEIADNAKRHQVIKDDQKGTY